MANQVWNVSKKLVPQPTTHLSLINHLQAQQFLLREVYLWLVCPFQETVNEEQLQNPIRSEMQLPYVIR
jgi:hypothetical protein